MLTRVRQAAAALERTPHWFMKLAIRRLLHDVEAGARLEDLLDEHQLQVDQARYGTAPDRAVTPEAED